MSESTPELPPYLADESTWTNAGGPSGGSLYTLPEVQAYQLELASAKAEGREPTMEDPTKRRHESEIGADLLERDGGPPDYPHNAVVGVRKETAAPVKKAAAKKATAKTKKA